MTALDQPLLRRLAEVYHESPIGRTTGMRISFDEAGAATCRWTYTSGFDHALRAVHGGLVATMLDNAGWFAAAAAHGGWVVTSDFHVRFLLGTGGEDLVACGRVLRHGRRLVLAAMDVHTESGRHVATATGAFCPTGESFPWPALSG